MSTHNRVSQDQNGFTPTESRDTPLSSLLPWREHATLTISPLQLCGGLSGIGPSEAKLTHDRQAYIGSVLNRLRRRHYTETPLSCKSPARSHLYYLKPLKFGTWQRYFFSDVEPITTMMVSPS
jgi:hypothetical protein